MAVEVSTGRRGIGAPGWALTAIVLAGLNLRPFLTGIGPLAPVIRNSTGLDYRGMAWLTLLPMVLIGVGACLAPAMRRWLGERRAVLLALALVGIGSLLRLAWPGGTALIATAALCGLGTAAAQAALPAIVKRQFPARMAMVMGLYSAALMAGGALGAQLTPWIAGLSGSWHAGLAAWALPAWAGWLLAWRTLPGDAAVEPATAAGDVADARANANATVDARARANTSRPTAIPVLRLLNRPRTWLLMASFGVMNGGYASLIAWLAAYYQERGWSGPASGGLIAVMSVAQAAAALALPTLAARSPDRRTWLALALAMQAIGFAGLAGWPDLAPLAWAIIGGAGLGGCFSLYLVVALDHLPRPEDAAALGALMQGGGFLLAGCAPWLAAVLHDATGSFAAAWWYHLAAVVLVMLATTRFDPRRYLAAMPGRA
ncbi:cyanate transporter [Cupriavidus gilardii]|uniref:Cyanate transporter n=1 Tax=Cupriavidus gilardii TaxID=82541 RepID=A0ABY4VI08_9BURK|nr:cyanate transporter [Cupriavidus gilardii]MCT9069885.1 cyanate transporter [Cupriavidus gilardii]QKS62110.1 cyanate transporter [Cupriavidus gilardii]USE76846.1 cyanate transporter [Cupriavidus gilardii]